MGAFTSLFKGLSEKRGLKILIVGLNAAGKTTILYKLKFGEIVTTTVPSTGSTVETVEYKNISFTAFDVGGQNSARAFWKNYLQNTRGVIFVVDSNDTHRIGEAREELFRIMGEDELKYSVLLVLANKQDLPYAMSAAEITDKLDIRSLKTRCCFVQATCATSGNGLYEGLGWMAKELGRS